MLKEILIAKINCRVTGSDVNYRGSITIDEELMDLTGLKEYDVVYVNNVNGNRDKTYVIKGKAGTGCIEINGALSPRHSVGDKIHINAYAFFSNNDYIPIPNIITIEK